MSQVSIAFENQEEVKAFEVILSAALRTGDIGIAKAVTHFHSKLEDAVRKVNQLQQANDV